MVYCLLSSHQRWLENPSSIHDFPIKTSLAGISPWWSNHQPPTRQFHMEGWKSRLANRQKWVFSYLLWSVLIYGGNYELNSIPTLATLIGIWYPSDGLSPAMGFLIPQKSTIYIMWNNGKERSTPAFRNILIIGLSMTRLMVPLTAWMMVINAGSVL